MTDQPGSTRPTFDATTGIDWLYAVKNGVTGKIYLTELQKLVGGSGSSTGGSTGGSSNTTNLFSTPLDLSGSASSKFTDYQTKGELTKPGPLRIVVANGSTGANVLYEEILTSKLTPGQTYTIGASITRAANSGTGKVRGNAYFVGPGSNVYAPDQTVTDGVEYRTTCTFTVPATGATAVHAGFDFTPGGGDFTFRNITLVAGSVDNSGATAGSTGSGTTTGSTGSTGGTTTGSTGGTTTGSTGTTPTNLYSTPDDLSADGVSKFFDYQPNGELSRPGGTRLVVKSPFTGPVIITEEMTNARLVPGKTYTLAFSFIRAANTGAGVAYVHVDWHGSSNAPDVETTPLTNVADGVKTRVSKTFTVPAGVANGYPGIRFNGPCDMTFSDVLLVEGSTDPKAA